LDPGLHAQITFVLLRVVAICGGCGSSMTLRSAVEVRDIGEGGGSDRIRAVEAGSHGGDGHEAAGVRRRWWRCEGRRMQGEGGGCGAGR
jgi:hypothetical protein